MSNNTNTAHQTEPFSLEERVAAAKARLVEEQHLQEEEKRAKRDLRYAAAEAELLSVFRRVLSPETVAALGAEPQRVGHVETPMPVLRFVFHGTTYELYFAGANRLNLYHVVPGGRSYIGIVFGDNTLLSLLAAQELKGE